MYTIKFTGEFKRQMKLCERRGYDMEQNVTSSPTGCWSGSNVTRN